MMIIAKSAMRRTLPAGVRGETSPYPMPRAEVLTNKLGTRGTRRSGQAGDHVEFQSLRSPLAVFESLEQR